MAGKRASGGTNTKDSGGFKVVVSDTKVDGSMRFAVSYDPSYGMTGVVGYGPTKARPSRSLRPQRRAQEWRDY